MGSLNQLPASCFGFALLWCLPAVGRLAVVAVNRSSPGIANFRRMIEFDDTTGNDRRGKGGGFEPGRPGAQPIPKRRPLLVLV
jgi:hypothetical protein